MGCNYPYPLLEGMDMAHKILIVDDEKMITDLLSSHLQDCGYDTLVANNSGEAMMLLQKQPNLIILDINMPGLNGLELCRNIRDHILCPIIFVTARISELDKIMDCNMAETTISPSRLA